MPKCVYCAKMYETNQGVTLVSTNGVVNYFCSAKCKKNKLMKKRKVRWILKAKKSRKEREAEIRAESKEVTAAEESSAEAAKEAVKEEKKQEESKKEENDTEKKEEKKN